VERYDIEEAEERKDPEFRWELVDEESEFVCACADGGGGSYPGCCTPNNQIGSVHLSGMESLSRRYRIALSRCPLPCLAAVRRAFLPLGDEADVAWESNVGRDRSVDDVLKVWENHPERRVGRLPMPDVEEEGE